MPLIGPGICASQGRIALYSAGCSDEKIPNAGPLEAKSSVTNKRRKQDSTARQQNGVTEVTERIGKPDSVPPGNDRGQRPFFWSRRCRRDRATLPEDPSRKDGPAHRRHTPPTRGSSYLVLLRMGFVRIPAHAAMERALTSPFHPYRRLFPAFRETPGRSAFCGTFPRSLGAVVNGHPVLGSPDFPLSEHARRAVVRSSPSSGAVATLAATVQVIRQAAAAALRSVFSAALGIPALVAWWPRAPPSEAPPAATRAQSLSSTAWPGPARSASR